MRNMTEIPQFMEFGQCLADGDLSAGLRCLDECIAVVRRAGQDCDYRLLQYKGNILHQSGDLAAARESYQQAYELAGESPLVLMTLAVFLPPRVRKRQRKPCWQSWKVCWGMVGRAGSRIPGLRFAGADC
ncbi:MAG: tetratricopeptide repeat protein [Candidatus Thiothrix singaporensis]|uniref:Tetratricopeptide repeat protein n=1 Tax=Candidatus Thiothrix singaporensis TaxID=2799669 RepID=A0A7L6AV12_9GAMM|nr:MAG: tetratricopeptide repeat protein [Candidatus Thiothrix singaporensis]